MPTQVWDAIRDIGALHTRLVPGFVVATRLEPGARIVTFANGVTVREPIVTLDEPARRLVWSVEGLPTTHYNASVEVIGEADATRVVWIADFLPDDMRGEIDAAMEAGAQAMQAALDRLGPSADDRALDRPRPDALPGDVPRPARPFADRPGARRRALAARDPRHPRRRHRPAPHRRRQPGRRRRRHGDAGRRRRRGARRAPAAGLAGALPLAARRAASTQARARALAAGPGVTLLCGRFEGIDERVLAGARRSRRSSLGDFVMTGGEIAAMALIDATVRLIPRVLGNAESTVEESFSSGLLEFPHYTRPTEWEGLRIPEVLLSGHHGRIAAWRRSQAERLTKERRPDLWRAYLAKAGKRTRQERQSSRTRTPPPRQAGQRRTTSDEPDR